MKKMMAVFMAVMVALFTAGAIMLYPAFTADSNGTGGQIQVAAEPVAVEGDAETVQKVDVMQSDEPAAADTSGKVYYVDAVNGSDDNDGLSKETPFLSLNKVNSLTLEPGDYVLLKRGCVWNGFLRPQGSGSDEAPIVIGMYGEDGAKPLINGNGEVHATVELVNNSNMVVRNLEVTNFSDKYEDFRIGILVTAKEQAIKNVTISNNYVHHVHSVMWRNAGHDYHWYGGIIFNDEFAVLEADAVTQENILIENNRVEHVSSTGIATKCHSQNAVIRNNIVNNAKGDGIIMAQGWDGIVERNIAYTCGFSDIGEAWVNIWLIGTENAKMQYNESYDCRASNDGQGFDMDNTCINCIMQYNYSHDNYGGFLLLNCLYGHYGSIVRYNISQNDAGNLFTWALPDQAERTNMAEIYNNTIYTTKQINKIFYLWKYSKPLGVLGTCKNNIFYILGSSQATTWELAFQAYEFEGNAFFGDELDHPTDPKAVTENPMLVAPGSGKTGMSTVDGYKLQVGSPCIGAGVVIEDNGGLDYWGNPVPADQNPNIGAYQGSGETISPTMDLAAGKSVTASTYNVGKFSSPIFFAGRVTDGNVYTVFSSEKTDASREEYVEVDLTLPYEISTIVLTASNNPSLFPSAFEIQVADGDEWVTVVSEENMAIPQPRQMLKYTFDPIKASRIRVVAKSLREVDGSYAMELAEISIYQQYPESKEGN